MGMWRRFAAAGNHIAIAAVLAAGGVVASGASVSAQSATAGLAPDRRPEGAPRIAGAKHSARWLDAAHKGISRPYPPSLGFLKDQGDWYTPFNVRGMTGPYDLRKLHQN